MRRRSFFWQIILIAVLAVSLLWGLDKKGYLDWFRRPVEKLIRPVKTNSYQTQLEPNRQDQFEREKLALEVQLNSLTKENERLRQLLGSPLPPNWQFSLAQVIGHDQQDLVLNIGHDQGVIKGQAVITANHLIGQIIESQPQMSRVRLINHPDSIIEAKIKDSVVFGQVQGRGGGLVLDQVLTKYNLAEDQLVVTSGEDGLPIDLIIGRIEMVDKQDSAIFQQASLQASWQTDDLEAVFVVRQ